MSKAWKWKLGLFFGLILVSAYLLIPTFSGLSEKRAALEKTAQSLPWYFSLLPDKGIHLGLDLRGGIYLEFDVDGSNAITNKIDIIVDSLKEKFKDENINFSEIRQDTKKHTIVISGLDSEGRTDAISYLRKYHGDTLERKSDSSSGALVFGPNKRYTDYLHNLIIKQSLEKVRNRIDRYGVAEPSIHRLGSDRIAVELPGIKDPDRAIGIIKKAGQLEFKIVYEKFAKAKLVKLVADARKQNNLSDKDFSINAVKSINETISSELPKDTEVAFEIQYDPITKKITRGVAYLLHRKAKVTGAMLKNAQVDVRNNEPYVSLTFNAEGTKKFGEVTENNVGKRMAILLDGNVMKAPNIREPILGGRAQITLGYGTFSDLRKEAEDLVLVLQEGALPARLIEATKTIVGPSLGADSIHKGIVATVAGALCVFVFMIFYYRMSGLLADVALAANLLFIMSALALFQATLTLPGIAGIVLTLGMAVDANVLIFERIREELRKGKTARAAIESGYHNAMRTIIDSNLTTLIAGLVLYQFGTGPIKGFAVTLIIGLSVSMYTACVCTRMVYDYFLIKRKITKVSI